MPGAQSVEENILLRNIRRRFPERIRQPLRLLRDAPWKASTRGRVDRYVAAHEGAAKLHLGAGSNGLEGWLNTDIMRTPAADVYLDITRPFPAPDASFDYVFAEHVIEHVPYEAGTGMLKESWRVLKPGGVVRVATPDLQRMVGLYASAGNWDDAGYDPQLAADYCTWIHREVTPELPGPDPIFVLNNAMRNWGHQFLYDAKALSALLEQCGFTAVVTTVYGESSVPALRNLERHWRGTSGERLVRFETLVVEGTKPQ